eukprot:2111112-Rhodomonas_salina.1
MRECSGSPILTKANERQLALSKRAVPPYVAKSNLFALQRMQVPEELLHVTMLFCGVRQQHERGWVSWHKGDLGGGWG